MICPNLRPLKAASYLNGGVSLPTHRPCGNCVVCHMNTAREKTLRAFHQSLYSPVGIFATFTYSEENLPPGGKLDYHDMQLFIRRLQDHFCLPHFPYMITGEYGSKTLRPHWHCLLWNISFPDSTPKYKSRKGSQVYESSTLTDLWGNGLCDFGTITPESCNYTSRYSLKKQSPDMLASLALNSGLSINDLTYDSKKLLLSEYRPIHKTSHTKNPIGLPWIQDPQNQKFIVGNGFCYDHKNKKMPIPRYYLKYLSKNASSLYLDFHSKPKRNPDALKEWFDLCNTFQSEYKGNGVTPLKHKQRVAMHFQRKSGEIKDEFS